MEATVAAPVPPPQNALSGQASSKKNTPTQSPSRKKIISAAQESLERAIAASPATPINTQTDSVPIAGAASLQPQKKSIVTPQGTWQNVVPTSSPQTTLPAVKNFLQMAFETVQRSQQEVPTAAQNTFKTLPAQPSPNIVSTMFQHSLQPPFIASPLSPQSIVPAPFLSLQSVAPSPQSHINVQEALPNPNVATVTALEKSIRGHIEQSKSLEDALITQEGQTSNTGEVKKISTGYIGVPPPKVGQTLYSGYTIYNTAWPANPKPRHTQNDTQKRSVMVAKRRQSPSAPKTTQSSETKQPSEEHTARSSSESEMSVETQSSQSSSSSETSSGACEKLENEQVSPKSSKTSRFFGKPKSTHVTPKSSKSSSSSEKSESAQVSPNSFKPSNPSEKLESAQASPKSSKPSSSSENPESAQVSPKLSKPSSSPEKPESAQGSAKTSKPSSSFEKPESAQVQPQSSKASCSSEKPESSQDAKENPIRHNASRVAQTYQSFKASQKDRTQNGPQAQSPKRSGGSQAAQGNASGSARPNGRRPPKDLEDDVDPARRVIVSGFPPYTQSQDLIRVLSQFGNCEVDKCRNRLAVVTFDTEAEAKSAIEASDEICIYGDFIEMQPFTNPRHVEELFRAYKKVISTEKGQDIIMPNKIDLTGDFYTQLENIQNAILLTREQVQAVTGLYVDLEMVLQQEWPGCVAIPFGSIPTGLGIKSSDADCYVQLAGAGGGGGGAGGGAGRARAAAAFVPRARRLLALYPRVFTQLVAIPRANTPIVKFRHAPSGFHCDVSCKTPLGAQNSKLVKLLLEGDARLARVAVLVKYWAKVHALTGTGRLTNYALTLMVVFYLQAAGLAPPVERLQRDPACAFIVDHWNAGFAPPRAPPPPAPAPAALPDLLGGLFEFYAAFDFDSLVVCPYLGAPVRKLAFDAPHALPPEFARYVANVRDNLASPIRHATPFCVQDPFEQSHNVASSVSARLACDVRAYLKFAADAYNGDRASGCRNFLRTILLSRPRLRRERSAPSTKVYLIPRVRGEFADADWRARVREILLDTIFERILRARLTRDVEAEERERKEEDAKEAERKTRRAVARTDREKYAGAVSKPVWRRKRNYSVNVPEAAAALVARQAAATEEIVRAAPDSPLAFELELGFRDQPRHLHVCARLVAGELDVFRQFVAFLHTAMFDWFKILLRPHLAPPREPEPAPADRVARRLDKVSLKNVADTDTDSTDSSKKDADAR